MDGRVDRRREHLDARGQAEQRRHLERLERADEQDQQRRERDRRNHAQRDPPRDGCDARAAHQRSFLECRVHRAKGRRHHQERHRRVMQAVDERHAGQRIHVDEYEAGPEQRLQRKVDETDLRAAEQDPCNDEQDARDDQRHDRQREEQPLERRVGSLVQPREQRPDGECDQRCAGGKAQRVRHEPPGSRTCVDGVKIVERHAVARRVGRRRMHALPQQESERHQCDVGDDRRARSDDEPLRPRRGIRRGAGGHPERRGRDVQIRKLSSVSGANSASGSRRRFDSPCSW